MGLKGMLAYRDIADSPINIFLKKTKFKKSNRKTKKGKTPKRFESIRIELYLPEARIDSNVSFLSSFC